MEKLILLSLLIACAGACQDDWISHEGTCYWFSHDAKSWDVSAKACQAMGAYLAEVEYAEEDHFLAARVHMIGGNHWIGLTDLSEEGLYFWMWSGTEITSESYTNWHHRQPDNNLNNENCVEYTTLGGHTRWNDAACSFPMKYICEKRFGLLGVLLLF